MKLKTFDAQVSRSRNLNSAPTLSFWGSSGVIAFNHSAVESLGLEAGGEVKFHQDTEHKVDWYLEKVTSNGLKLRALSKKDTQSLMICCGAVVKAFGTSVGKTGTIKVQIATHTVEGKYYALLTSTLK